MKILTANKFLLRNENHPVYIYQTGLHPIKLPATISRDILLKIVKFLLSYKMLFFYINIPKQNSTNLKNQAKRIIIGIQFLFNDSQPVVNFPWRFLYYPERFTDQKTVISVNK